MKASFLRGECDPRCTAELYCFPHAGAGASVFHGWQAAAASTGLNVRPLQYPGREDRLAEPAVTSFASLVAAIADELAGAPAGPFALFGHSMGAMLAFAVTRELEQRAPRVAPSALFLSGCVPPPLYRLPIANLDVPDFELVRLVSHHYESIPEELFECPEMVAIVAAVIRADLHLVSAWPTQPPAPLSTPIFAYGGTDDHRAPAHTLPAWSSFSRLPVVTRDFPGGHFYLFEFPERILQHVSADFQAARSRPRPAAGATTAR